MPNGPLRVAVAQSDICADVRTNGENIRTLMREAAGAGCRLIHFPEGALSGYVKAQIKAWGQVDWSVVDDELEKTAALAGDLGLWAVVGCNHRGGGNGRPHNSLYVLSDTGVIAGRYDKRFCSHTEITGWYAPGAAPLTFSVDGITFGCVLCIEIQFPELFSEYERLNVDCVLLSAYSDDPIYGVLARAHAAVNCTWISYSVPASCAAPQPSMIIGPDGHVLAECGSGASFVTSEIDQAAPRFDIALKKARPWRRKARQGDIYKLA